MLCWLPVPQQIQYKIVISVFDCVHEHCPAYLTSLHPSRQHFWSGAGISGRANLHSAERHDMLVPSTRTQLGRQSFHIAAPAVCNALPSHLRSSSISRGQFRDWLSRRLTDTSENFLMKSVLFCITFTFLVAW